MKKVAGGGKNKGSTVPPLAAVRNAFSEEVLSNRKKMFTLKLKRQGGAKSEWQRGKKKGSVQ